MTGVPSAQSGRGHDCSRVTGAFSNSVDTWRIVEASLDLMEHLQGLEALQVDACTECGRRLSPTDAFCPVCGTMRQQTGV